MGKEAAWLTTTVARATGRSATFLIVFWPVGIVLCWRSSWHIVAKVLASVAVAFMVYFSVTMYQATQALMAAGMA